MAPTPEDAVRRYLTWLEDPASIVDAEAVRRAEAAVEAAGDPMVRLHALADLEHARATDPTPIIEAFVAHAAAFAAAESIPVGAFRAMGVPDDVLRRAGLVQGGRRGATRTSGGPSGPRAPQVGVDEIKAAVARLPKRFTLAEVAREAGGGSPGTVRKAVDELMSAGRVAKLGPKPDHQGPGRAPVLYELV